MSSRLDRLRGALGFRLALWYAVLFVASSVALGALTYVLLSASLRQRDRDLIGTTLVRYASAYERAGLPLLSRLITADRVAGRYEPLLVRVIGESAEAVYFDMPRDWRFDLEQLSAEAPRLGVPGWAELRSVDGSVLEVASVRLRDGTLFQVGKSSERRAELLGRFRLHVDSPADLCVNADRNRLRQVAANLLDNAVKYTPRGGRIDLVARREGGDGLLVVRDTGSGISAGDLPRIFDRLYRGDRSRSERGLGLGLSLVKAIVEAHQGRVSVQSSPDQGSTFTVRLPACDV
jgi:anti-sigma regulatory factor (Ser/Thr protein kinase)